MKNQENPVKDAQGGQIDLRADHYALVFVRAAIKLFIITCFLSKSLAWSGGLSLPFATDAAKFLYRYEKYHDKTNLCIGAGMGIISFVPAFSPSLFA